MVGDRCSERSFGGWWFDDARCGAGITALAILSTCRTWNLGDDRISSAYKYLGGHWFGADQRHRTSADFSRRNWMDVDVFIFGIDHVDGSKDGARRCARRRAIEG